MKDGAKLPIIVVVVIADIGVMIFAIKGSMGGGNLDQGQVKYTPGVPPWKETDPSKQGPGAAPPSGAPAGGPPAGGAPPVNQNGQQTAPAGMGAPARG